MQKNANLGNNEFETYLSKLDAFFNGFRATSLEIVSSATPWDIVMANAIPENGMKTYLTKGFSVFHLGNDQPPPSKIRQEYAFTIDTEYGDYNAIDELNLVAFAVMYRGFGIVHEEVINYEKSPYWQSLQTKPRFRFAIAAERYWLPENLRQLDDKIPMKVMEILPLHRKEAELAVNDNPSFISLLESERLDILDLKRKSAV